MPLEVYIILINIAGVIIGGLFVYAAYLVIKKYNGTGGNNHDNGEI